MAPTRPASSWTRGIDLSSTLLETGSDDYELYEADEEFVVTVELPGFDLEDVEVTWDDGVRASEASAGSAGEPAGVLNVAAEHHDERRNRQTTDHRRFRFPKRIEDDATEAEYRNGVLEVRLPVETGATARGTVIEVQGRGHGERRRSRPPPPPPQWPTEAKGTIAGHVNRLA